jgi:hypothetical protein
MNTPKQIAERLRDGDGDALVEAMKSDQMDEIIQELRVIEKELDRRIKIELRDLLYG